MPKSRKRKKKSKKRSTKSKRNHKPYEVVKHDFVKMENPFPKDIPFEERLKAIVTIGKKSEKEYKEHYKKLIDYFGNFDPLYLCAFSHYYFCIQEEGIDREAIDGYLEFPPFYLEILQSIALFSERKIDVVPLNDKVDDFKKTVKELNTAQAQSYFKLAEKSKTSEEVEAVVIRTEMMVHTLAVRNWAYPKQMEEITSDLANLVNDEFYKKFRFKGINLIKILTRIVASTEEKVNAHLNKTRQVILQKKYEKVLNVYEELFPQVDEIDGGHRNQVWEKLGKNLDNLKAMLLMHSDLFLADVFQHSSDEITNSLDNSISKEEVLKIMNELSLSFGDLGEFNKEYIFLDNPVHSKPFIKVEEEYFSVVPHLFLHISIGILESLINKDQNLKQLYIKKKGKYLENKVVELFKNSFPAATVLTGSLWFDNETNKEYENDLIVLIEEFALIVECKSGIVPSSAKRGAPDRLFKAIDELIKKPSEQAIRFENFLKKNRQKHLLKTKTGKKNDIDSTKIKYFIPLGITLSHLGSIGSNLKKLISAKVINSKIDELAPSISYGDLEIIFDLLSSEAEKLHYLARRREFGAHCNFHGDELDLLGFYLENGFNIGEAEYDQTIHIDLMLSSKALDPYYTAKARGIDVKKPTLEKSKYWSDLLKRAEQSKHNRLISSFILLSLPKEDQLKFERKIKELKQLVLNDKLEKKHNYMQMSIGPARRSFVLIGYPYKDIDTEVRNDMIGDIIHSLESDENLKGYLVIGYNLNANHYPYSVLAGSINTKLFDKLEVGEQK